MSLINLQYIFATGNTIISSQHNTNNSTIYNDYNGNITNSNIASGAGIVASKLDLTSPGNIGTSSANTGSFTTLNSSGLSTLNSLLVGSVHQGDILYDNGTSLVRLTPGINGQYLQTQGNGANPQWSNNHGIQEFISSGTFTAPVGISMIYITACAPGGGGASSDSDNNGWAGGGGGQSIINYPYPVTGGNSYTVTIGSIGMGATTSSGVRANGTSGGNVVFDAITLLGGNASTSTGSVGGTGGSNTGSSGFNAVLIAANIGFSGGNAANGLGSGGNSGAGGSSALGQGGAGITSNGFSGNNGNGYGSGGSGSHAFNGHGGNGAPGIVIVQW